MLFPLKRQCASHKELIAEIALGFYVLNLFELKIDSPMATDFVSKDTCFYLTQKSPAHTFLLGWSC